MKPKKKKLLSSLPRKIHLPQGVWTYRASAYHVVLQNPDCTQRWLLPVEEIVPGMTPTEIERAQWKGGVYLTPSVVRDFILSKFYTKETVSQEKSRRFE